MRMSPWATVRFPFLDFSLEMGVHTPAAGLWDHREGRGGLSRPLDALKWPPSCSQGTRNNAGSSVALHLNLRGSEREVLGAQLPPTSEGVTAGPARPRGFGNCLPLGSQCSFCFKCLPF